MKFQGIYKIILMIGFTSCFYLAYSKTQDAPSSDSNIVTIDISAQKAAGIEVATLQPQVLSHLISAPGEVIPNANLTTKITTRVPAQVLQRHVQEGQHIKAQQPLLNLSSVDMAKTQGDLLLAWQELERVKSLGKDAISAKRFSEAKVAYQNAYSTVLAYGMTEAEIKELLQTQKPSNTKGDFTLLATRDGTISNINFTEGELVEPGKVLLQIVEEKAVWIDAKLPPDLVRPISVGDPVRIIANEQTLPGSVIQVHHQLDETTRTRSVRVEVLNANDLLHPGQFVDCQIETGKTAPLFALPIDAVLRTADGDWAVYIEREIGKFQQTEVKMTEVIDNQAVIQGLPAGTRVVTKGAFFVHSELNKKGSDAHGH